MAAGAGGEVEGMVVVEVDVLVGERGDVLDLAGGDQIAARRGQLRKAESRTAD